MSEAAAARAVVERDVWRCLETGEVDLLFPGWPGENLLGAAREGLESTSSCSGAQTPDALSATLESRAAVPSRPKHRRSADEPLGSPLALGADGNR